MAMHCCEHRSREVTTIGEDAELRGPDGDLDAIRQLTKWMQAQYGDVVDEDHLFAEDQWQAIIDIHEHLYHLHSIEHAIQLHHERNLHGGRYVYVEPPLYERAEQGETACVSQGVKELTHGQLTILEAAYEHMQDKDRLRRL